MSDEPDLAPWVYWAVVVTAVLVMAALWWLTATFHVDPGGRG